MSNNKNDFKPYIPADSVVPEFTVTSILIGIFLAIVFGAANAYLGLSVGMTLLPLFQQRLYLWESSASYYAEIQYWKTTLFRPSVLRESLSLPERYLLFRHFSCGRKKEPLIHQA